MLSYSIKKPSYEGIGYTWKILFIFLYIYRCLMAVIAEKFISKFTLLGDAETYQKSYFFIFSTDVPIRKGELFEVGRVYSTLITETVGAVFHLLFSGNIILIDIGFQTLAFFGIYKFLTSIERKSRMLLYVLILTPSFSLWSSIAGKEAIIVLFVGIICANIVNVFHGNLRFGILELVSLFGILVFKIQYIPVIITIYGLLVLGVHVKQKSIFAISAGVFTCISLFLYKDKINSLSFNVLPHFMGFGSSRDAYWVEKYDVFYKAPYGMFQAFFGPTLDETSKGILQLGSFIESTFILIVLICFVLIRLPKLPVFCFFTGVITLALLLFSTYPLGILNAGTAIRYRTGHLLLIFLIISVIFSRNYFTRWQKARILSKAPRMA